MKCKVMNFGDNTRVVSSPDNTQVVIPIGAFMEADIHEVHYQMIRNSPHDTLLIVPSEIEPTAKLTRIMELMPHVLSLEMSELIVAFDACMGGPNPENLQPTRGMIQTALREVAREEVRKSMARAVLKSPLNGKPNAEKPPKRKDNPDGALATLVPEAVKAKKRVIVRERL